MGDDFEHPGRRRLRWYPVIAVPISPRSFAVASAGAATSIPDRAAEGMGLTQEDMAYAVDDHEALWAQLATRKPRRPLSAYDAPPPPPHAHARGRIQSGRCCDEG